MNKQLSPSLWCFVWHFLSPYKHIVILYSSLALLAGCWGPFNSLLIKYIINALSVSHAESISWLARPASLLVLNFLVFDNVTWRSMTYLNYKYQPVIKNNIISETFSFVLGASPQFFHDNLSGRIAGQINTLADSIECIVHNISAAFFRCFSMLLVALLGMYSVNPLFFYVLAIWFFVFSWFSIAMSKHLETLSNAHADAESAISGQLVDSITNANSVAIFARSHYEACRLDTYLLVAKKAFRAKKLFLLKLHAVQGGLIAVMLGFLVYFLTHLYGKQLISIGDFALILGLGMEVGHITWYTMSQVDEFYQAVGKCKQSLSKLIVQRDINDIKDAHDLSVAEGQITFSHMNFCYKDTDLLFKNTSVTIEAGQKVGLVGYSGSGKSTFVNLILRLYDITNGHIFIDSHDIRTVTQDSLHSNIAMIPQDPSLFHRSLMENIRYGRIEATDDEVIEAAKKAHAHEFIMLLPQGYASPVGERGVKLSGGQRQRIAIARAILKNAPILILDEATSQLDSVTEHVIQDSLWELMQNKTTLIIAHRLSTLLSMDRIMVFDQGKIVEDGTHAVLLAAGGLYKTLWDAQVGGFLPDKRNG